MVGRAELGRARLLAGWILLLGCGVEASDDTYLLMQAPFAPLLNWTDEGGICGFQSMAATVACDDHGNVIFLNISAPSSGAASSGSFTLPSGWGNLKHLRKLTFSGASGSLPTDWGRDGASPQLQVLRLSYNNLSGSLPPEWANTGSFPQLQEMWLFSSSISGTLPREWGSNVSFPRLQQLVLDNNTLSGSLPAGCTTWGSNGSFPHLEVLSLSRNNLSGSLPPDWGRNMSFQQLKEIWLNDNHLGGSLPWEWGSKDSFPQLQELYLWNNSLSGKLPPKWGCRGSFMKLQWLDLHNNSLTSSLPEEWGSNESFPKLQKLYLWKNSLSGSLPREWGSNGAFPQLLELVLSRNSLTSSLPPVWGSNGSFMELQKLYLSNNTLSGSLPLVWGKSGSFPGLRELYLYSNMLTGSLPQDWGSNGSFMKLQKLWLYNNTLSSALPLKWGSNDSFPQLQELYLWNNSLNGSLPPEWGSNGSFLQLLVLDLSSNALTGSLPAEWGVSTDLNMLTIQNIPSFKAAAPFKSVKALVLWDNNFTGGVPLEWTNNPHYVSGRVLADVRHFQASRASPHFAKGICLDSYRYGAYRNWSYEFYGESSRANLKDMPDIWFKHVREADALDPCSLDPTTRVLLIALWSSFGALVLLDCMEERLIKLLHQLPERFQKSITWVVQPGKEAIDQMKNRVSSRHRVLLGMLATVLAFWADIASDVPVIAESWGKQGAYFYILLGLMLGSHILDAVLVARYAVAKGDGESGHSQIIPRRFSKLHRDVASFMVCSHVSTGLGDTLAVCFRASGLLCLGAFGIVFSWLKWYFVHFLVAVLALPALDVLGLVNPSRPQPPDSVFKVDLLGYQTMRLVIGAVFRTVPTAVVLTVIAARGNNPDNGTYFDSTVVSVSLTLSAVQIIIVILQVRQRASAPNLSKLQLLRSVFTLDGLSLLSDEGPSQLPKHKGVELRRSSTAVNSRSILKEP